MKAVKKKELILKAASESFSRFGYEKTTLDDIGRLAKLNKASLYYYFKNKEEIFMQVILAESEKHISGLQEKVMDIASCEEKIVTYLSERLKYHREVVNLHQLSLELVQQIQPIFDDLYRMVWEKEVDFMEKTLQDGQKNGEVEAEDLRLIADSLMTIADGLKHEAVRTSDAIFAADVDYSEIDKKMNYITRLIFKGLKK